MRRANRQEERLVLEWLPAHRGIAGNELADVAAKQATRLEVITDSVLSYKSGRRTIKRAMEREWHRVWNQRGEGRHLVLVKDKIEHWPIASIPDDRRSETVMARMRIGHAGLRAYLFRFGLHTSPYCECGEAENVQHVLIDCPVWSSQRREIFATEIRNGQLNMRTLLGGGGRGDSDKRTTLRKVTQFLTRIDKIETI